MKILSSKQIQALDQFTIKNESIDSSDLMERASLAFCHSFKMTFPAPAKVYIFCGPGNNGGDGLCIARILKSKNYLVKVFVCNFTHSKSKDFNLNLKRLDRQKTIPVINLNTINDFPEIDGQVLIIDAIFGSGLSRPIKGLAANIIEKLNALDNTKVAVDVPSGLYSNEPAEAICFEADHTITFHSPKLSLLLPQNYKQVGAFEIVDIGLSKKKVKSLKSNLHFLQEEDIDEILKQLPANKFNHKGSHGHALLVGGSKGKNGAILLAAKAAMVAGAGLVTAHIPECNYTAFQGAFPEAMVVSHPGDFINKAIDAKNFKAAGIGPGLGQNFRSGLVLRQLLLSGKKLVLDADALNIISKNNWQSLIPAGSVLTPHPKELERLTAMANNDYHQLDLLKNLAKQCQSIVLLKRAHTVIALPDGRLFFNSTGNPAMGTAGSGDVLCGLITGLLAKGFQPEDAAKLGVFLHGKSGDQAVKNKKQILASDLIDFFRYS